MPTRIEPVHLYSRRHFVFLGLGIAASGAFDPWRLLTGNDELVKVTSGVQQARMDDINIRRMLRRLEQLRDATHDVVRKAIHHEADMIMAEAKARSLQLDSYYRWGVRL